MDPNLIPGQDQIDTILKEKQKDSYFDEVKASNLQRVIPNNIVEQFQYLKEQSKTWKDLGFNDYMERAIGEATGNEGGGGLAPGFDISSLIDRGSFNAANLATLGTEQMRQAITDACQVSNTSRASSGTVASGSAVYLVSTVRDPTDINRVMVGSFEVSAFQDSVALNNQIPTGSAITVADFLWYVSLDPYFSVDGATTYWSRALDVGRSLSGLYYIKNLSAGDRTIIFDTRWRFFGNAAR